MLTPDQVIAFQMKNLEDEAGKASKSSFVAGVSGLHTALENLSGHIAAHIADNSANMQAGSTDNHFKPTKGYMNGSKVEAVDYTAITGAALTAVQSPTSNPAELHMATGGKFPTLRTLREMTADIIETGRKGTTLPPLDEKHSELLGEVVNAAKTVDTMMQSGPSYNAGAYSSVISRMESIENIKTHFAQEALKQGLKKNAPGMEDSAFEEAKRAAASIASSSGEVAQTQGWAARKGMGGASRA